MDLGLVPTEELIEALFARFDHVVFGAVKAEGTDTGVKIRWTGTAGWQHLTAIGLTARIGDAIQRVLDEHEDDPEPEDT